MGRSGLDPGYLDVLPGRTTTSSKLLTALVMLLQ